MNSTFFLILSLFGQCPVENYSVPIVRRIHFYDTVSSYKIAEANFDDGRDQVPVINDMVPRVFTYFSNGVKVREFYYEDKFPYKGGSINYSTYSAEASKKEYDSLKKEPQKAIFKEEKKEQPKKQEDVEIPEMPSFSEKDFNSLKKEIEDLKQKVKDSESSIPTLKSKPKPITKKAD